MALKSVKNLMKNQKITFEEAVALIEKKRQFEQQRQIKTFVENPDVEILNGRYGPYIAMGGKNYKIPTGTDPVSLDLAACMEIIEKAIQDLAQMVSNLEEYRVWKESQEAEASEGQEK